MDATTSFCYYPMDRRWLCIHPHYLLKWLFSWSYMCLCVPQECTADGQFVFTIYSNISTVPVNPTSLHVAAKTPCKPILSTNEFATFKFFVSECGTKTFVSCFGLVCLYLFFMQFDKMAIFFPPSPNQTIGDTTVYMAEVRTAIRVLNLKYGVITRDHPVRQVLCS